ncbi:ATP-binding protein [Micromonospora fluostatini]|uniref:ATP-binding protein n=1 Tax=Micromonospora sp. JCM 30529 TaxID=3421643 RepID=UPI003D17F77F
MTRHGDRREGTGVGTGRAERSWCVVVPHHAVGARMARRRLVDELTDVVSPTLLPDLVAVLAELVGNAVRHADALPGGVVRVAWRVCPATQGVRIQLRVTDGGAAAGPRMRPAGPEAIGGRGLHIVAGLSTRWGVDRDGLGQSVWAEFDPVLAGRADLAVAG